MKRLIEQLKRRGVVKAGFAYLVAAWLVLQVADTLGSMLELPPAVGKLVIVLLVIGFPVTLVLSWYYEFVSGELVKEDTGRTSEVRAASGPRPIDLFIMGGLAVGVIYFVVDKVTGDAPGAPTAWVPRPLTSIEGFEIDPALSPDGDRIAYVWRRSENEQGDIYVRAVSSNEHHQLTDTTDLERYPVWSPDATKIAFARYYYDVDRYDIIIKPVLGGADRVLYRTKMNNLTGLDWSPDGRFLVFRDMDPESPNPNGAVFLHEIETGKQTQVSFPARDPEAEKFRINISDQRPTISPDGNRVAFARWRSGGGYKLCIVELPTVETSCRDASYVDIILDIAWGRDSRTLYYLRNESIESSDREIVATDLTLEEFTVMHSAFGALGLGTARDADKMVLESRFQDHNIWRIKGPAFPEPGLPEKVTTSTRDDWWPHLSSDGEKLVFVSHASGRPKVWIADADGGNSKELGGIDPIFPGFSPDGNTIVFGGTKPGQERNNRVPAVFMVPANGGYIATVRDDWAQIPSFSADGTSIIYQTLADEDCRDGHNIMRMDSDGSNPQLVAPCATLGLEGPHGRVYFFDEKNDTIGSVAADGTDRRVEYQTPEYYSWALSDSHLAVIDKEDLWLKLVDLESGAVRNWSQVVTRQTLPSFASLATISISRDDQWIAYTLLDTAGADLVLLEPAGPALQ